ncbi:MAG: hypothetical protein J2P36_24750, partial [Ktedonobacteraceae bacterium]|nr:hypothetical protein [Ktedonobacteraceae bacterium]
LMQSHETSSGKGTTGNLKGPTLLIPTTNDADASTATRSGGRSSSSQPLSRPLPLQIRGVRSRAHFVFLTNK